MSEGRRARYCRGIEPGLRLAAYDGGRELEVVSGSALGWKEPWARVRRCRVVSDGSRYGRRLVDEEGIPVDDRDVQLARLRTAYDLQWTPPQWRDGHGRRD